MWGNKYPTATNKNRNLHQMLLKKMNLQLTMSIPNENTHMVVDDFFMTMNHSISNLHVSKYLQRYIYSILSSVDLNRMIFYIVTY